MLLHREILWCKDERDLQDWGSCEVNQLEVNFNLTADYISNTALVSIPRMLKSKLNGNCLLSSSFSAAFPVASHVFSTSLG